MTISKLVLFIAFTCLFSCYGLVPPVYTPSPWAPPIKAQQPTSATSQNPAREPQKVCQPPGYQMAYSSLPPCGAPQHPPQVILEPATTSVDPIARELAAQAQQTADDAANLAGELYKQQTGKGGAPATNKPQQPPPQQPASQPTQKGLSKEEIKKILKERKPFSY